MTIENTYIVDRNLKTVVDQLEEIKELLGGSSSGGSMIINLTEESEQLIFDKTAGECFEAYSNGIICIACLTSDLATIYEIIKAATNVNLNGAYNFITDNFGTFSADSENDYPTSTR